MPLVWMLAEGWGLAGQMMDTRMTTNPHLLTEIVGIMAILWKMASKQPMPICS